MATMAAMAAMAANLKLVGASAMKQHLMKPRGSIKTHSLQANRVMLERIYNSHYGNRVPAMFTS